jgi:hypothetical protein
MEPEPHLGVVLPLEHFKLDCARLLDTQRPEQSRELGIARAKLAPEQAVIVESFNRLRGQPRMKSAGVPPWITNMSASSGTGESRLRANLWPVMGE